MNITLIGTGFVGVVSAAVYASFGHQVIGLDVDENKIAKLKQSQVPFYEPNLENLLTEQQKTGRLSFTSDYQTAISQADLVIIAVGTPSAPDGQADLKYVVAACESLAPFLKPNVIVAIKSTVPPGTLDKIESIIQAKTQIKFFTASLPEFLREGTAVEDTLHPDRIVIGATDEFVFKALEELHKPLNCPVVKIAPASAQMAKYASNTYLATRITFINQMADLCEKNGANIQELIQAIGYDKRIGQHYWYPGFGYGGSCFPKDVKELAAYSRSVGEGNNLFNKVNELNEARITRLMDEYDRLIGGWTGKTVAVLGLSFKPNTDDMREAPSIKIIEYLRSKNAVIKGFDPKALSVVEYFIKPDPNTSYHPSLQDACHEADVIMAVIEWPEIVSYDFGQVRDTTKKQWFIDGRNQFDHHKLESLGYDYMGIGKGVINVAK
jgi:UDPglucose 6-dehydrogenase